MNKLISESELSPEFRNYSEMHQVLTGLLPQLHILRHAFWLRHSFSMRDALRYCSGCVPLTANPVIIDREFKAASRQHIVVLLAERGYSTLVAHLHQMLASFGYEVRCAPGVAETALLIEEIAPTIVVVVEISDDRLLDALLAARLQQGRLSHIPSLMVLGPDEDLQREIAQLTKGADDYLPYSVRGELLRARLQALQRRQYRGSPRPRMKYPPIVVDHAGHRIWIDGHEQQLAPRLFHLLSVFVAHPASVLSLERLLSLVWNDMPHASSNTVKSHVCQLRRILASYGMPGAIVTVSRIGYRYDPVARSGIHAH